MALILSSERSHFIEKAIDMYTDNRLGQYTKYLSTTPMYVTYYAINQAQSRVDIGTGLTYDIIGKNSPIRYNKIKEFPIYNVQQITPNGTWEDGKYEIDVELNDITILPNTVKPRGDDFVLIHLPRNQTPLLFRVTNFRLGTIQSNDFYMIDLDLYRSDETWKDIELNVVEEYYCVFENIGTNNNVFITADQKQKAEDCLAKLNILTEMYHSMYYYSNQDIYVYYDYIYDDTNYNNPDPNWSKYDYICTGERIFNPHYKQVPSSDVTYYDIFLDKFIMDSNIFFNDADNSSTSIVAFNDFEPTRFDYLFNHTLWNAIILKDTKLLTKYMHYYNHDIKKYTSCIVNEKFPNPTGNTLVNGGPNMSAPFYFDKYLIDMLIEGKPDSEDNDGSNNGNGNGDDNTVSIVNIGAIINQSQENASFDHIDINPYDVMKIKKETKNETGIDDGLLYVFDIIYNYINGISMSIDYDKVIAYFDQPSEWKYRYHLIIIYILKNMYSSLLS